MIEVVKYSCVNDFGTDHQSDDRRGPAARRRRAGHRPGVDGNDRLRRRRPAPDRLVHGLRACRARATRRASRSASHPVPATTNPLGVKGCGEAGCAGSLTSLMNAVVDALSEYGIRHIDMPATPLRVWQAIRAAKADPPAMTQAISAHRPSAAERGSSAASASRISSATTTSCCSRRCSCSCARTTASAIPSWPRAHGLQRRRRRAADPDRLPGRPHQRAHRPDRGPLLGAAPSRSRALSIRSGCSSRCWRRRHRQHRLSPGRLFAPVAAHAGSGSAKVFSFHTFSGMVGSAIAPVTLLFMQSVLGWRGAFLGAAVLGSSSSPR